MSSADDAQLVRLRPCDAGDDAFLMSVYASTRAAELSMVPWDETQRATFVRSQHLAQLDHYRKQCPEASYQIIEFRGRPIGRLFVDRRSTEIRILDITLLPEHCGQSIGTPIIRELMAEASRSGRSLSIYLDSFGPASRSHSVFSRLGFKPAESSEFHTLFVWNRDRT